ncbi:MAG: conjugative transfer signal peptidase TraF [Gemmatimonadota bacterium]|nr:conjugative transfer signal peptidase TraF [Gemmatimonadota bacterium]
MLVALVVAGATGVRWTYTGSIPAGVYHFTSGVPARGVIVAVCLRSPVAQFALERRYVRRGRCPSGVEELAKPVLAMVGDTVELGPNLITVNGRRIPHSESFAQDSRGRPLPHYPWGKYVLQDGDLWLFSPYHPRSFDSRYFGPVQESQVVAIARPLATWR